MINELDIPEFMEEHEEMEDQSDNMLQASNVKKVRRTYDIFKFLINLQILEYKILFTFSQAFL